MGLETRTISDNKSTSQNIYTDLVLKVFKNIDEFIVEVPVFKHKSTEEIYLPSIYNVSRKQQTSYQFFGIVKDILNVGLMTYGNHLVNSKVKEVIVSGNKLFQLDIPKMSEDVQNYVVQIDIDLSDFDVILCNMDLITNENELVLENLYGLSTLKLENNLLLKNENKIFDNDDETYLLEKLLNSGDMDNYFDDVVQMVSTFFLKGD